ncbi:hypothetical protein ES705_21365 [subsurface metagenome]
MSIIAAMVIFPIPSCSIAKKENTIEPGAYQILQYHDLLAGKNVGIVANHTSIIENVHLIDTLQKRGIRIRKIFTPEHGFKGKADAGALIDDQDTAKSVVPVVSLYGANIPVVSLYGAKRKPSEADLKDLDIMVFDLQDVGVRFYTYLSTLHNNMEACAEFEIPLLVLDRPNPNGFYIDGPVLKEKYKSFIGLHQVPVVYGMTIGEYALMINGEGWLKDSSQCQLHIIKCKNYSHSAYYNLPVNPSPNLREMRAIYLYPSLAFFEGTIVSEGRGTDFPFLVAGHPAYPYKKFSFTPMRKEGSSLNPKLKDRICYGIDLQEVNIDSLKQRKELNLDYLFHMYDALDRRNDFFIEYFNLLAGTDELQKQILNGMKESDIRKSWTNDLDKFKQIRVKYLLYSDFE